MEALGVKPGDKILFVPTDIGYEITTRKALVRRVRGSLARDDGRDMTQELLDERRAEAAEKVAVTSLCNLKTQNTVPHTYLENACWTVFFHLEHHSRVLQSFNNLAIESLMNAESTGLLFPPAA